MGFINAVKTTCDEQKLTKRCEKALNSLENAVRKVSGMLNEDSNVPETIAVLRGKFRQVCSLLNISPDTTSLPDRTF